MTEHMLRTSWFSPASKVAVYAGPLPRLLGAHYGDVGAVLKRAADLGRRWPLDPAALGPAPEGL